jgi:hypothetical protein
MVTNGSKGDAAAAAVESYRSRLQDLARAAQLAAAVDAAKLDGGGSGGGCSGSGMASDTAAAAAAGVQPAGSGKVYDLKHSGWWGSGQVRCQTLCMLDDTTATRTFSFLKPLAVKPSQLAVVRAACLSTITLKFASVSLGVC